MKTKPLTGVEYLISHYICDEWDSYNNCSLMFLRVSKEELEYAKKLETEQIIYAYNHGQNNGYMYRDGQAQIIEAEQYYNETYNS